MKNYTKKLVLEDGHELLGYGFGADTERVCEIVFNTSVVGYQEILSDPSYTDQMVVMTYPLIGNYGITDEDYETKFPSIGAMVVRENNNLPSNFRYTKTFGEVLEDNGIPAISGLDTRMITRILRKSGSQRAIITSVDTTKEEALAKIAATPIATDLVSRVSCRKRWFSRTPNHKYDIVAIDCGLKYNIIRSLNACGCNVTVVPYTTSAEEILSFNPDGVLVSNGPGAPTDVPEVVATIEALKGRVPMMGIGLGHQLIALAYGAKCSRMTPGHRGGHPVKVLESGKILMTAQNHSFVVDGQSLAQTELTLTHVSLLDGSVEGFEHKGDKVLSVEFHPESAPGPQDAGELFDQFIEMIKK